MSDSESKEKQEQITVEEGDPLYHVSYVQTWENYHRMDRELYLQKVWQLSTSSFTICIIIGTIFMAAEKLQLFGWICYFAAILFLVGIPLAWKNGSRSQFRRAKIRDDMEWDYAFYKDSFKVNSRNTAATRKYSNLFNIVEGEEDIYLLLGKNISMPVPRDHGERDEFLLSLGKKRVKDKISPILCYLAVISGILLAFFGITQERLPARWLLQTWVYVICSLTPFVLTITTVLAGISWNLYRIPSVQNVAGRIALRVLSVLLCGFIVLGLGFLDFLFILGRYPVKQNENGTYTEHVDDSYMPYEYYLYQPQGPFFLRYIRPMSDSGDVDPTISESEWYDRIDQESDVDTESTDWETQDDASSNSEVSENDADSATSQESSQDSESEQIREGALEIFDQYFAAEGSTFQEGYTAKGDTYFVLNENDSDITYLQYDRDSQNGNCGLYVLFKASKSSDGSWSPSDAQMQNTYAYEYSTGAIVESGKTDWSDAGSEEYQNLTGEP